MRLFRSSRGVSPVISNILMVAIVVVLAATVSVFAFGFAQETTQPGPIVGQSSGELASDSSGSDDQIVRITHVAGDPIDVSNMEIVVRACGQRARIVNLPAPTTRTTSTPTYLPFDSGNFEGNRNLLSPGQAFGRQSWDAGVLHEDTSNTFTAGSSFEFRIKNGACRLDAGDQVVVQVVHTPTNSVPIKKTLTAT